MTCACARAGLRTNDHPETNLPKPEWGTKRICANCGARFYDFAKATIVCPSCSAPFDLETAGRTRRSRGTARAVVAEEEEAVKEAEEAEVEDDEEDEDDDDEIVATDADPDKDDDDDDNKKSLADDEDEDEEDPSLIEDASELGDDDDVSEVIDGDLGDEEQS